MNGFMKFILVFLLLSVVILFSLGGCSGTKSDSSVMQDSSQFEKSSEQHHVYIPGNEYAPAKQVEASLQNFFDVDNEYLKKSQWSHPENDTYLLIGGFGGGGWMRAISAEQKENQIIIKVGIFCAIDETEVKAMGEDAPVGLRSSSRIIMNA